MVSHLFQEVPPVTTLETFVNYYALMNRIRLSDRVLAIDRKVNLEKY